MNDTTTRRDQRISGAGSIPGGTYGDVAISGAGTISGDIDCRSLRISGAGDCTGAVRAEKIRVSGSGSFHGPVTADDIVVSGEGRFSEDLSGKAIKIKGTLDVGGTLSCEHVKLQAMLRVDGDCEAERFDGEGAFRIGGLLNAEEIRMSIYGPCSAREIGGSTIEVRQGSRGGWGWLLALFGQEKSLHAEAIEADSVYLEHTTSRVVRGTDVEIGPECVIDLVEYAGELKQAAGSQVKASRKTEPRDEQASGEPAAQ